MGNRNRPFYRLVVQDSHWRRDGKTIADIGWYDPVKNPAQHFFREKEIYSWLEKGVQLTETARSLLKNKGILSKFKTGAYKEEIEQPLQEPQPEPAVAEPKPEPEAVAVAAETPAEETPIEEAPVEKETRVSAETESESTEEETS